jgi:hypothetical protein
VVRKSSRQSNPRFASVPDPCDENVRGLRKNNITYDIARCAEADYDLGMPNAGKSCNRSIAVQINASARRAASGLV